MKTRRSNIDGLHNCSEKELLQIGIYTITSKVNNKIYVGSTAKIEGRSKGHIGFKCRWGCHVDALITNKHYNQYLQNHVNKYGINDLQFDILEVCEPQFVNDLERYWIYMLDSVNTGFNLCYSTRYSCGKAHPTYKNLEHYHKTIELLFKLGLSVKEIGKEFRVSSTPITRVLNTLKIDMKAIRRMTDISVLYTNYINSNLSIPQTAKIYNLAPSTVLRSLKRSGYLTKIEIVKRDIQSIYNRYKNGQTVNQLANEYKIHYTTLSKLFIKCKLDEKEN